MTYKEIIRKVLTYSKWYQFYSGSAAKEEGNTETEEEFIERCLTGGTRVVMDKKTKEVFEGEIIYYKDKNTIFGYRRYRGNGFYTYSPREVYTRIKETEV